MTREESYSMNKGVLYIIFSLGNGGSQRMLVNVMNNIETPNRRKILFLYNAIKTSEIESQLDNNYTIYRINSKSKFKHFLRLITLLSIIKKERIDTIFSFALNGTYMALLARAFYPFREMRIFYRMVSIDSVVTYSNNKILSFIKRFCFANILGRFISQGICQSGYMYESLETNYPQILKHKFKIIKNFLDTQLLDELANEEFNYEHPYFVYVGRLSPEKNVVKIIEAFSLVNFSTLHHLLIIGNGPQMEEIVECISNLKLEDRVKCLGFQKNPYKYIKNASALILFSSYEGMPNVILESMYCKTAVIASNFKGVDDIAQDRKTAFIVEIDDINALSGAIQEISLVMNRDEVIQSASNFVDALNRKSIRQYRNLLR